MTSTFQQRLDREDRERKIIEYFESRVKQMGPNFTLTSTTHLENDDDEEWGIRAIVRHYTGIENTFQSVYVFDEFQNKGMMKEYVRYTTIPFITAEECNIESWFRKNKVPYMLVPLIK